MVQKSGAWYYRDGEKIGQGRENAKQYLLEHPDVCNALETAVREHFGLQPAPETLDFSRSSAVEKDGKASKSDKGGRKSEEA